MKPLENLKQHVQVLGGLDHVNATPGPDGAGDHARANGTFLTGVRVSQNGGGRYSRRHFDRSGGRQSDWPSHAVPLARTYRANPPAAPAIAIPVIRAPINTIWPGEMPTTPVAPEANPRLVFERCSAPAAQGDRAEGFQLRQQQQHSVLDFVHDDARELAKATGRSRSAEAGRLFDQRPRVEKRIQKAERVGASPIRPSIRRPAFRPVIKSTFKSCSTCCSWRSRPIPRASPRCCWPTTAATVPSPIWASPRATTIYRIITNDQRMLDKVAQIDRWYVQQFAEFLQKLEDTKDRRRQFAVAQFDDRLRLRQCRWQPALAR